MKASSLISCFALALLALSPVGVMPAAAQGALSAEPAPAPRTGVRFVIVSPSGETLPSPLYCKQGKSFTSIRIGGRTPSPRVKPEAGGIVRFWKENPMAGGELTAGAGTSSARGNRKGAAATAAAPVQLPEPFMTVKMPGSADSNTLCILVPTAEGKAQTYFIQESDVPPSGVHLINFSPYPLQMILSKKGDFSDKSIQNVAYFQRSEGISDKNRWSYVGENGENVAFMLMYKTGKSKDFQRARASRFSVSSRQSQISVVVKDPTRDAIKMLSIQLTEPKAGN